MNDITIFFSVLKIIFRLLNKFICFALTNIFNLMNFRLTNFTNKLIFKKAKKTKSCFSFTITKLERIKLFLKKVDVYKNTLFFISNTAKP